MSRPPLRYTIDEAQAAADAWGFNCGPGALTAVLGMTPDELRPHLGDFEQRGYTNPSLMAAILRRLNVPFQRVFESAVDPGARPVVWPRFGLVRIQWSGPWTKPGVPMAARYQRTHWIAVYGAPAGMPPAETPLGVYDVNVGHWIAWEAWTKRVAPDLAKSHGKGADGTWWPTHCLEIQQ